MPSAGLLGAEAFGGLPERVSPLQVGWWFYVGMCFRWAGVLDSWWAVGGGRPAGEGQPAAGGRGYCGMARVLGVRAS